jgi:hypothetical protein
MTAERTTCDDFIIDLAQSVPPLHPQACLAVNELLNEAHRASHDGHTRRVVQLMKTIRVQVAVALIKEGIAAAALGDDVTAGALHKYAAAFDADAMKIMYPDSNPPLGEPPMAEQPRAANVPPVTTYFDEQAPAPPAMVQRVVDQLQTATPERMAKAHQRVTLHNTAQQVFYIQDRSLRHIEFRPGERKEIDMIADELQYLIYQSRTDRGFYESGPKKGEPFPPHPVKVINLGAKSEAPQLK